jgi:hypothetical protein
MQSHVHEGGREGWIQKLMSVISATLEVDQEDHNLRPGRQKLATSQFSRKAGRSGIHF